MGKKVIGICALCKKENVKLCESHIIPKGVYKRAKRDNKKTYVKRNILTGDRKIIQSGEKQNLLCSECEKLFNKYETDFFKNFYDPYLINRKINNQYNINDFIFSLNWRVLFLDLIATKSKLSNLHNMIFEHIEKKLREYLMSVTDTKEKNIYPKTLKNHIFIIDELLVNDPLLLEAYKQYNTLNGYIYIDIDYRKAIVLTYFDNFIFVTELDINMYVNYENRLNNYIDISLFDNIKINTEEFVKKEFIHNVCQSVKYLFNHYDIRLRDEILEKYKM